MQALAHSVRARSHHGRMLYRAILICSEDECTEIFEATGTIEELETLACDCGCGLQVIGWPDSVEDAESAELELVAL